MFQWYVINTYSGHENKVKTNLEHRIVSMNQGPRFRRVVVGVFLYVNDQIWKQVVQKVLLGQ